jgi:hypothetical protein
MSMDFGGPPPFFNAMFVIVPVLICGVIAFAIISGIVVWSRNNASPLLSRPSKVVAKRTEVWGGSGDSSASTRYYVTFEFDDRSRLELQLKGSQYGLLAEGDRGTLKYQGTRFLDFAR